MRLLGVVDGIGTRCKPTSVQRSQTHASGWLQLHRLRPISLHRATKSPCGMPRNPYSHTRRCRSTCFRGWQPCSLSRALLLPKLGRTLPVASQSVQLGRGDGPVLLCLRGCSLELGRAFLCKGASDQRQAARQHRARVRRQPYRRAFVRKHSLVTPDGLQLCLVWRAAREGTAVGERALFCRPVITSRSRSM